MNPGLDEVNNTNKFEKSQDSNVCLLCLLKSRINPDSGI